MKLSIKRYKTWRRQTNLSRRTCLWWTVEMAVHEMKIWCWIKWLQLRYRKRATPEMMKRIRGIIDELTKAEGDENETHN